MTQAYPVETIRCFLLAGYVPPPRPLELPSAEWTTECAHGYSSSTTDLTTWLEAQPDPTKRDNGKSGDRMALINKTLRAAGLNCEAAFEALQYDPRAVKDDRLGLLRSEILKCMGQILKQDAAQLAAAGFGEPNAIADPSPASAPADAAPVPAPPQRAPRVSLVDLHSNPAPPQRFVWDLWMPAGTVTLLGAHGGAGKSQLVLHLAVCVALGMPFMGTAVEQCRVLVFSGEDPTRILRRRLAKICTHLGVDPAALATQLLVLDATVDPTLHAGGLVESEPSALRNLSADLREFQPGLLILDNASDTYAGNEIARAEVRGFMRLLVSLGAPTDAAVLLLAHVDKVSVKTGSSEAYSGSTAWHNSARSRWFLSSTPGGLLQLEHAKSNFGPKAAPIFMKWSSDGLIEPTDAPGGADDRGTILTLIEAVTARGTTISPFPKAHNNPFKVLQREASFPRFMTRDGLDEVLTALRGSGQLIDDEIRGKNRKSSTVLRSLRSHASSYEGAPPPECALSAHRGVGRESAHGQVLPFRALGRAVNDPEEHF